MTKASFISHRVTDEGLYIMGITGPGLLPDVETFVPRDDAEEFGWLDPLEEEAQTEETPTPEWLAEMQRLTSENASLRAIVQRYYLEINSGFAGLSMANLRNIQKQAEEVAPWLQESAK